MYDLKYSGKIKKDMKTCQKRVYDFRLFENILERLINAEPLEIKNQGHNLKGNYKGFRECNIAPDWLLVYRYNGEYLELSRTGTHSDLFGE